MTQSGYRVSKLQQSSRGKRKKKLIAALVAVIVVVLGVASLFVFGVVHWPHFGSSSDDQSLSFLVNPAGKQAIEAPAINILVLTYEDRDPSQPITDILVASYGLQVSGAEFYDLPGALIAHTSDGKAIKLSEALKYNGGKTSLATSEVQRLLGEQVHYTLLVKETDIPVIDESLGIPVRGEDEYWSDYLATALGSLRGLKTKDLTDRATQAAGYFQRSSSFSSTDEQTTYVADMVRGFAPIPAAQLAYRDVPGVEILNGCGVPGIGGQAQARLEAYGFPVKDSGRNAKKMVNGEEVNDFSYSSSVIYYHAADARVETYARWLQAALDVKTLELREDEVLGEGTVTLIVGNDLVGKL